MSWTYNIVYFDHHSEHKYVDSKAIMGEVLTEHFSTIFVHTFWEIGGVLFWRGDIFSSQLGSF